MSTCGCLSPSNPDCLACPSTIKRLAATANSQSNRIEHNDTQTVTLNGTTLYSKTRHFVMESNNEAQATGTVSCQNDDGTSYAAGDDWTASNDASLSEQMIRVQAAIRFMDLRHDILVVKETTSEIDQTLPDGGLIPWNSYGVVSSVHKLIGDAFNVTTTTREVLAGEEIYREVTQGVAEIPGVLTAPPKPGQPQNNEPEAYYLYGERWQEDGGYDLYYPPWLRGSSLDDHDRDLHRSIYDNSFAPSMPLTSPLLTVEASQDATGSWAVDKDGNRFFSQRHSGGSFNRLQTLIDNVLVTMPDADLKTLIPDLTDVCYPVSIT